MNLSKLFETQKELDDRIVKKHYLHDNYLLDYKILALLTELGELANEARFFKFWSEDREPNRTGYIECDVCTDQPGRYEVIVGDEVVSFSCQKCDGHEEVYVGNRMLEEYVDCLHFILSIGNELGIHDVKVTCDYTEDSAVGTFNKLFETIGDLNHSLANETKETIDHVYKIMFELFAGLGVRHLDFSRDKIEQAYYDKNKVNHERQDNGY